MRSAMRAPSQLPGRGPLMWMMPLHLHVNQKSDYGMMMMIWYIFHSFRDMWISGYHFHSFKGRYHLKFFIYIKEDT